MASARYTLNIIPDEPGQPPAPMTPKKKWENFWFYYKWHVLVGMFVLLLVALFIKDVVFQVRPDYSIGVLTRSSMPYSVTESLQQGFETLCDDRNGDGRVYVQVLEYVIDSENTADAQMQMASVTKLMGDVETGESMLFLTDDLAYFEELYGIFAYNDGTTPPQEETPDYARMGMDWAACPALAALELGQITYADGTQGAALQDYMKDFKLLLRVYEGSKLEDSEKAALYYRRAAELFSQWAA